MRYVRKTVAPDVVTAVTETEFQDLQFYELLTVETDRAAYETYCAASAVEPVPADA